MKPHGKTGPFLLISFLLMAAGLVWVVSRTYTVSLAWVQLLIMAAMVAFHPTWSLVKRSWDPFEIANIFSLVFGLSYLGRALLLTWWPGLAVFSSYWRPEQDFERTAFYSVLGLGSFYLGYYSGLGRLVARFYPAVRPWFTPSKGPTALWLILAMSVSAYALHAALLGGINVFLNSLIFERSRMYFGYGWLTPFQTLSLVAVPLGYVYGRGARLSRPFLIIGGVGVLGLLLMTLSRGVFLTWFVMIAVCRHYGKRWIAGRQIFMYGVTIFALMVGLWWLREAPFGVVREDTGDLVLTSLSETLNGFDTAGMVLANYPDPNPFLWGRTIMEALAYPLVPRVVWPSKPAPYGGTAITEAVGGFWTYGTHVNAEIIGELYANFSAVGVVLGMILHGVIGSSLYLHLIKKHRQNAAHQFLYAYLVALVPGWQRLGLGGAIYTFLQFFLPVLLILLWVHGGFGARESAKTGLALRAELGIRSGGRAPGSHWPHTQIRRRGVRE